ncbi:hypothetical protein IC757_01025 [Wenzhouxiangella sp. AB-CW3]|uniref:hypothetical protein n=1 Tax=Wenzhouxiangella sp. AB-CW3 TaxID=2771012 RepID=UPI00168B47C7|nr:hypothetical protein [Wenzhouxiangella sp. AB-CW3]QOC22780.1 hypothetical protein IC757_01025 [Wenzhouxiangella sp. AB-CW3]
MKNELIEMMRKNVQADQSADQVNVIDDEALKSINGGCGGMGGCQPNPFSATLCPDGTWYQCP